MAATKMAGDRGEHDVIDKIKCPNCGKKLMALPQNYPLFDVQCEACYFRAQIKSANSRPKNAVFGAGWAILAKVLKAGYPVPPLIVNFQWTEKGKLCQVVRFYPFIPRAHLKRYTLSEKAKQAGYEMFIYAGLDSLPFIPLFEQKPASGRTSEN